VAIEKVTSISHEKHVSVVTVRSGSQKAIYSLSVDPEEDVSIDKAIPVFRSKAIGQRAFKASIVHRFLIAQYRQAVRFMSEGNQVSSISGLKRCVSVPVNFEQI